MVAGCAVARMDPPPAGETDSATVLGIPNARFWVDRGMDPFVREATLAASRETDRRAPVSFLALSGGADEGAFGAGLLNGWTASGTRPEFKLVTGVSTGSLIAPFAFLGPAYDGELRSVFTDTTQPDIFKTRMVTAAIFDDALSDTSPLFALISRYANDDMLAAVAREYGKGRLLLIGTTNIDVQRPVIWNMGAIAASGKPGALDLFRRILLASASIPGAFPPVLIDVESKGRHYQEMHVDGGTVAQTFVYPAPLRLQAVSRSLGVERERTVYVIRNSRLSPEWASTKRQFLSIAGRAIATMIHYSGVSDIVRTYSTSQRDGVNFRLAYIGQDFPVPDPLPKPFDQTYMRSLFDYAYQKAVKGYPWETVPPGFTDTSENSALSGGRGRLVFATGTSAAEGD